MTKSKIDVSLDTARQNSDIDRIVDTLVSDDTVAKALKDKLHDKLDAPKSRYVRPEAVDDSDDDLWDNMPV